MKRLLALPRTLLVALLRYPRVTLALGVFFLISLIAVAGPWIGIETKETRLISIVAILFLWILFLLWDQYRTHQHGKQLEQSLQNQAKNQMMGTRPDRRAEIEHLKVQFEKAIASLKQSKLGKGRKSSTALYVLPWYMFIGPPASGKSTALLHSGLQFPQQVGKRIQGVGGTRNCDWWFTSDAVLLDTAGRYVTEDDDQDEWLGFLTLLRQYRKRKPINGIFATISVTDLLQASEEEVERHAKTIRNRIDELIQRLGIVFPVYLLFTKCDLLQGFVEFFEDLSKSDREQVWGATFPIKQTPGHLEFDQAFQKLCHVLQEWRMMRLANARGTQKMQDIYGFPLQFASGGENFSRFVEILFASNPYQENPIFRGFYFISGTQEGNPMDRILGAVSRASGLPDPITSTFESQTEPKSYFIKNLFTDVAFPDQLLSSPTSAMERQRGYIRVGTFIASVSLLLASIIGLSLSFLGNKHLIGVVRSAAERVTHMPIQNKMEFEKNTLLLDRLQARVTQMASYQKEGVPIRLRGGLYQGEDMIGPLRKVYFAALHHLLIIPVQNTMERELGRLSPFSQGFKSGSSDDPYALLKAYLMMSDPSHVQAEFLEKWMHTRLKTFPEIAQRQTADGLKDAVSRQIQFYSRELGAKDVPVIIPNPRLIKNGRNVINRIPLAERLYAQIRHTASTDIAPYTLATALQDETQDLLSSDYTIPAFFTAPVWQTSFQDQLKKAPDIAVQESWVLGPDIPDPARLEAEIEKLYNAEYVAHWKKFIEATRVQPAHSLSDAARRLEVLSQAGSPLVQLLVNVAQNTNLGSHEGITGDDSEEGMVTGLVHKVKQGLRLGSKGPGGADTASPQHPVALSFQSLHTFALPKDPKIEPPLSLYTQELGKLYEIVQNIAQAESQQGPEAKKMAQRMISGEQNEIKTASKNIEKLIQKLNPELQRLVGPILSQPVHMVRSGMTHQTQTYLNERWKTDVYDACIQSISGRYPFERGSDASLLDVADFFHPQSGILWKFYESELKPFIEEGPDRWEVKTGEGGISLSSQFLENLKQARLISEALFVRGGSDVKVDFNLYPYSSPGVSESQLHLDGTTLRYRNEPQEWHEMSWPGSSGSAGGSLQVSVANTRNNLQYEGPWGFFKLLDAGRVTPVSATNYRIEWKIGERPVFIRYDLKAQSYKNPFKPGFFTHFRCLKEMG